MPSLEKAAQTRCESNTSRKERSSWLFEGPVVHATPLERANVADACWYALGPTVEDRWRGQVRNLHGARHADLSMSYMRRIFGRQG